MNLRELLAAVPEAGLKLLNKKANLDRTVTGMDTGEPPDVARYIQPNSLVLTTAMVYREKQDGLIKLIHELNEANVAGLAIKLGRFVNEISPQVLAKADELEFPLLSIPSTQTLGMVADLMQSHLLGQKARQFHYALDIQNKISKVMFRDASFHTLLHYFSSLLGRPVLYYDYFFEPVASGVMDNKKLVLNRQRIQEIGNLLREQYKRKAFIDTEEVVLECSFGQLHSLVTPVTDGKQYPFFLALLNAEDMSEPFSFLVTEQVGGVFSFVTYNQRQIMEKEWHVHEEIFLGFLRNSQNSFTSNMGIQTLLNRIQQPGQRIQLEGCWQTIAVGYKTTALPAEFSGRDNYALAFRWLEKILPQLGGGAFILPLVSQERFLLLKQGDSEVTVSALESIAANLRKIVPLDMRFGIANQSHGLSALAFSYVEAMHALEKALTDKGTTPENLQVAHHYYSEGAIELFQFVPEAQIQHFCRHILGDFAYPANENDATLRATLKAFLDNHGDMTLTGKHIHAHRNTVKYRLDKMSERLGKNIFDPTFSLDVRLALMLSESSNK